MIAAALNAGRYPRQPIVVVTSGFPRISETFALNELLALHRAGLLAAIVATKRGDDSLVQPDWLELAPLLTVLPAGNTDQQAVVLTGLIRGLIEAGLAVGGVHGYFAHRPAEVADAAAAACGLPFSFSVHSLDVRKVSTAQLQRRSAQATVVVTCNTDTADVLTGAGVTAVLIPHGVDVARFRPGPAPTTPRSTVMRLLAVGRLVEKKGLATLLDALADVAGHTLTIVGDGPERVALTERIERLGLADRVTLAGRCTHAELPDHYRAADVVVVPSIVDRTGDRDGLPNVVLEAMASGCPIIASDVAAIASAIRPDAAEPSGVLVPPGDAHALAGVIADLAEHPARRAALGAAARRLAEREFDLCRCAIQFCEHVTGLASHVGADHG